MLIGLDFGSHHSSLGLWSPETGLVQVFADDMGSRTIPCMVGFRKDEILVGHAAQVQRHKNNANTFENIRKLLENESSDEIYIPALEKSITVIELASHYFRHLTNQVKDQIGKQIKDCVITIPTNASERLKSNIIESARGGGLKVRSFIPDSIASPLAHRLDDHAGNHERAVVIVVDFGWSKCEISCLEVVSGVFSPLSSIISTTNSGSLLVDALTKHCAKDFQRRSKIPCLDNTRSMMRLATECESAVKILSTSAEAAIDLDSLCEGIDYAGKISRVRFEDLCLTYFMSLRELVNTAITQAIASYSELQLGELTPDSFSHIVLAGGFSSVPKIQSIVSTILPRATILRNRIEPAEALCIGACWHGAVLSHEGLLENALTISPAGSIPCCGSNLVFTSSFSNDDESIPKEQRQVLVIPAGTPLPINKTLPLSLGNSSTDSPNRSLLVSYSLPQSETIISRLDFALPSPQREYETHVQISITGEVEVTVCQENKQILARLSWKE